MLTTGKHLTSSLEQKTISSTPISTKTTKTPRKNCPHCPTTTLQANSCDTMREFRGNWTKSCTKKTLKSEGVTRQDEKISILIKNEEVRADVWFSLKKIGWRMISQNPISVVLIYLQIIWKCRSSEIKTLHIIWLLQERSKQAKKLQKNFRTN